MDENEQHKEVYAHFGLAVFMAQVLEHAIVNALVCCDLIPSRRCQALSQKEWSIEVDRFMDGQFENTMGRLIKALRSAMVLPQDLADHLAESLRRRNFLIHSYFRECDVLWLTEKGRLRMIDELRAAQDIFTATDRLLDDAIQPLMLRYGFTEEAIQRCLEERKAAVQRRSPGL
jgi:hypothetical protein